MFPMSDPRIPKIAGRVSLVQKRFSKVTREVSIFLHLYVLKRRSPASIRLDEDLLETS